MIKALALALIVLIPLATCNAADTNKLLEDYMWEKRILLTFAPSKDSPQLQAQQAILTDAKGALKARDLITWTLIAQSSVNINGDYKPHLGTDPFYKDFDVKLNDFTVILIGKDGDIKHRANTPISVEQLSTIIDAMPMRQREMQQ